MATAKTTKAKRQAKKIKEKEAITYYCKFSFSAAGKILKTKARDENKTGENEAGENGTGANDKSTRQPEKLRKSKQAHTILIIILLQVSFPLVLGGEILKTKGRDENKTGENEGGENGTGENDKSKRQPEKNKGKGS